MQAFTELSKLLTGVQQLDPSLGTYYQQKLEEKFGPTYLHDVLQAFEAARKTKKPLDTLKAAMAADTSQRLRLAAKQIVKIWYYSQFNDPDTGRLANAGQFARGLAWALLKAPPHSNSKLEHGYWTKKP